MDDQIAEHAFDAGHWPGLSIEQIKAKIAEVRLGHQEAVDFGNGRRVFRKGSTILIKDGCGGGSLFRPSPKSAARYFADLIEDEQKRRA